MLSSEMPRINIRFRCEKNLNVLNNDGEGNFDIDIDLTQFVVPDFINHEKARDVLSKIVKFGIFQSTEYDSVAQFKRNAQRLRKGKKIMKQCIKSIEQYRELTQENWTYKAQLPRIPRRVDLLLPEDYDFPIIQEPADSKINQGGRHPNERQDAFLLELMSFFYACYGEEPKATGPKEHAKKPSSGSNFFQFLTSIHYAVSNNSNKSGKKPLASDQSRSFWELPNNGSIEKRIESAKKISAEKQCSRQGGLNWVDFEKLNQEEGFYTAHQNAKELPFYVYEASFIFHEIRNPKGSAEITH